MARHRFLLGAIALSIGFSLSLFFEQNLQAAMLTGLITLPATLGAAIVTDYLRGYRTKSALAILKARTRSMQRRGAKIYELLVAVNEERQRAIANLNALQAQLKPLQNQVLERWEQSEELAWRVKNLTAQKQDLEAQIQAQEQQTLELTQGLTQLAAARQQAEDYVNPLKTTLRQLHNEVKEARSLRDQLNQEIQTMQGQKQPLTATLQQLQKQIQQLEQRQATLKSTPKPASESPAHPLQMATKQLQIQVSSLRGELDQLETQILQRRTEKEQLEQQLGALREQVQRRAIAPPPPIAAQVNPSPPPTPAPSNLPQSLPEEWTEFMVQLSSHEFRVLQAIATQPNPAATLKQIAEEQVTMPEMLIDAVNERAVDTLGDVVIEPGSVPVAIAPEHQALVQQVVAAYEYLTK